MYNINGVELSEIWLLKLGEEPFIFTCHFHGWDYAKRKVPLSFDSNLSSVREALAQYNRKYTYLSMKKEKRGILTQFPFLHMKRYQELLDKKYPKGIDTTKLEEYLDESEFMKVFEMSAEEFSKQPLWKRQNVKRDLGLY